MQVVGTRHGIALYLFGHPLLVAPTHVLFRFFGVQLGMPKRTQALSLIHI